MGIKISDLPVASQSNTYDIFPVVQDNTTKQIQQSVLLQDVNNDITELNNDIDRLDNRIDEAIAEFTYPLSYKGEVQTFQDLPSGATAGDIYTVISENKNYIWNGTEWVEYAAAIDFTNIENQIKTTEETEQAEEHTIQNTAPVNGKIDVSGNSTQETRSGKNLYNIADVTSSRIVERGINYIKSNFTSAFQGGGVITIPIENKKYIFKGNLSAIGRFEYEFYKNSTQIGGTQTTTSTFSINNENGSYDSVLIRLVNGEYVGEITFSNMQLEEGTTATEYEPYGVSPSPDYPSEIHNVGDNVNLFDKDNANRIQAYFNTGNTEIKASGVSYCIYIPITGGKTYTVTKKNGKRLNLGTTANTPAVGVALIDNANNQNSSTGIAINGEKCTLKTSSNANYLVVQYISIDVDTDSETTLRNSIKIIEGTQATPYSPYNCGNSNILVESKNIFDETQLLKATDWSINSNGYYNGTFTNFNNAFGNGFEFASEFKENTRYIMSLNAYCTGGTARIRFIYTDETIENISISETTATNKTLTTASNKTLAKITGTFGSGGSNTLYLKNIQLEEGTIATDYVPHQSQLITFPFTEGQRLMLGDYLASDGIHHVRKQVVFDGSSDENWYNVGDYTNTMRFDIDGSTGLNDGKKINENKIECNLFKSMYDNTSDTEHCRNGNASNNQLFVVYINKTRASNLADFKTWLSNNPITVEYELENEIIEPYTPEQEEAYWQLQHTLMYEGYTKVECIDETKCKTIVEYYYNNELNATYAGRIDGIDEEIHELQEENTIIKDVKNFIHSGANSSLDGTYTDATKDLISLTITPKKTGNYLLNISIPIICSDGTAFLNLLKDGTAVQQFAIPNTTNKSSCVASLPLTNLTIGNSYTILLQVTINNATNYTILNFMPISFTAIEI